MVPAMPTSFFTFDSGADQPPIAKGEIARVGP